jgi:hypothetical protein
MSTPAPDRRLDTILQHHTVHGSPHPDMKGHYRLYFDDTQMVFQPTTKYQSYEDKVVFLHQFNRQDRITKHRTPYSCPCDDDG